MTTDLAALLRELLRRGEPDAGEPGLQRALFSGEGLNLAAVCILDAIRDHDCGLVGGLAPGASALSAAVALAAHRAGEHLDALLIQPLGSGEFQLLGPFCPGDKVAVITGWAGDGEALLTVIAAVEARGGVVRRVVTLVDPQLGAAEVLRDRGHLLHSILR